MQGVGKARGEALRRLREAKPWTQAQLAKASGLSSRTIMRVEGGGEASAETVMAICAALDVPASELPGTTGAEAGRSDPLEAVPEQGHEPPAPEHPAEVAPEPPAVPVMPVPEDPPIRPAPAVPRATRWLAMGRRVAIACSLGMSLATIGTVVGLQAAWNATVPHQPIAQAGMESFWTLMRLQQANRLSVRYSTLVPADAPERAWEIWQEPNALQWSYCERWGDNLSGSYRRFVGSLLPPLNNCEDQHFDILVLRRDEAATEAVVGPMGPEHMREFIEGLTGDPSVKVEVIWSTSRSDLDRGASWLDPRASKFDVPGNGRAYLRIRFSGAAS